jgi:hypothetical protein
LYCDGAAPNYLASPLQIGGATPAASLLGFGLRVNSNMTGNSTAYGIGLVSTIQSDVLTNAVGFLSQLSSAAGSYTLPNVRMFSSSAGTLGAGSTISNMVGFYANPMTLGTTNIGFQSVLASASGAYNFYASGTASNYMAGNMGIGTTSLGNNVSLNVSPVSTVANAIAYGVFNGGTIPATTTNSYYGYNTSLSTAAASFTNAQLIHYCAQQGTIGAGSSVTTQFGFLAAASLTGATSNYGFYSNLASASGVWNFVANGTANNAFAGNTRFGATSAPVATVDVTGTIAATGVITSTLAIGTAPFTVTSTTPVANLNIGGNAATATTANALNSATTTVVVSAATAPTSGQVLTATSGTAANWQTLAATNVSVTAVSTNATFYPTFVSTTSGSLPVDVGTGLTFNPSTNVLTTTTFSGDHEGTIGLVTPSTGAFTTVQSTISTGTAPFTVASTTPVANLVVSAAQGLTSATTTVSVSAATAPISGQVLTATSSTTATWQAGGGSTEWPLVKPSTGGAETLTITAGYQFICKNTFTNNNIIINNGDMFII